ncbi:unnamed protein product [Adineta ricciae]|uniref:Origin recognition complex subunit 3 n=1 Tax=Adineta ricciae TaxID=249248 RepID=A0A813VU04_ADIRI|nr:unnamed protein product [Adineta ricciae]CAF1215444.1 unnamed protein product [Adineta ricciae]
MDTTVEVHSITRSTQRSTSKKPHEKLDLARVDHITNVITNVKSQLHARLVTSVLDIMKKNEKFRRITQRCFEHIPVMALCMDSNISEHSHLFDELQEQLAGKFHSIIIKLLNPEQYSSIHNILKMTKTELNKFYPDKDNESKNVFFQLSKFVSSYNELKESEKRSIIFIIPEFESINISVFENLITLLSLQIKFISISFVLGLSGGEHSLQRLVSSRIASKLSIDTIYDSSARKYYEYIIKSLFLTENDPKKQFSITAEQLQFVDNGYFETFSLAWLEHALKFIAFSETNTAPTHSLNICLFNAVYVSCNQLPNYPLGRYRSSFYGSYLSNSPIFNELTLSVNSSTTYQLETCLNSFIEHSCNENSLCKKYSQLAKKILIEQQQQIADESQALSNTLRSVGDRKLNRYREQVFIWLKQICEEFISSNAHSTTKITDYLLQERLIPMTRATFIRELTETNNCKQAQTPDLALLFRIYTESGTKIPLSDWFESFATLVEEREVLDNDADKSILARFVHGLAELDYLGFTKTSLQRSYHATKLTWDT